jgi:hypothetical protein
MESHEDSMLERLAKHPIVPPHDSDEEPTDSNPVPLSPTDPQHRTYDGTTEPATPRRVVAVPGSGVSGSGTSGIPVAGPLVKDDDSSRK